MDLTTIALAAAALACALWLALDPYMVAAAREPTAKDRLRARSSWS
jgi:hypothetical protein